MRRSTLLVALALTGCQAAPSVDVPTAPTNVVLLGAQMQKRDEQLVGQRFRTLLDFEHSADSAFVAREAPPPDNFTAEDMLQSPRVVPGGHTGNFTLHTGVPVRINVSSILFGATLPGDWTLIGGYVRPTTGEAVRVSVVADGKEISSRMRAVPAGIWAFVAVDLTGDECQELAGKKKVQMTVECESAFDLDDVLLVDNRRTLVDTSARGGWTIKTLGLSTLIKATTFARMLPAGDVLIDEAGPLRMRAHDQSGKPLTLLPDGRLSQAGDLQSVGGAGADMAASHRSPADITLDDAVGKIDRETPGDVDNDGYNESRLAYQIVARTPRLTLTIRPRSAPVVSPLLEIRGLPAGPVMVNVEGKLVDRTDRLPDGTVLVLLPMTIETPTEVTISASGN